MGLPKLLDIAITLNMGIAQGIGTNKNNEIIGIIIW